SGSTKSSRATLDLPSEMNRNPSQARAQGRDPQPVLVRTWDPTPEPVAPWDKQAWALAGELPVVSRREFHRRRRGRPVNSFRRPSQNFREFFTRGKTHRRGRGGTQRR